MSLIRSMLLCILIYMIVGGGSHAQVYSPADPRLPTRWTSEVSPENALSEYPRPMMVRDHWKNLNGLWDFQVTSKFRSPGEYHRKILVPYPVESVLSGIKETIGAENMVWYRRSFSVENPPQNGRVLLHFGASDWETHVFVNGDHIGLHQGGYDSFSFDITGYLTSGDQVIEVGVWDPTDIGDQPVGKQTHDPRGIWYTANTGIWQTVWLEYVPETYIQDLKITPEVDQSRVKVMITAMNGGSELRARVEVLTDGKVISSSTGYHKQTFYVRIPEPELWSPENPYLYDLNVSLLDSAGVTLDQVESYVGMRKISIGRTGDGYTRLFLNNQPLFQLGPLDQGWWPDGLYTAPTDDALRYDIQVTKDLGFNMLRKHVKVEPQRFYYWCDVMGVLVWQDMPSGGRRPARIPERSAAAARQFKQEYREMIDGLYNHPSIVMWIPFNEGWGQYRTEEIVKWTQLHDPTRLVNNASGWADQGIGDVVDRHAYPGPAMHPPENNRASILGEFGGQALAIEEHLWIQDFSRAPDHFKTSKSRARLHDEYEQLILALYPLVEDGLAAAVYTQMTDVESEVNGLMTYDRDVIKFDEEHLREIHGKLYK